MNEIAEFLVGDIHSAAVALKTIGNKWSQRQAGETTMSRQPLGALTAIRRLAALAFGLATVNAQNLLTDLGPGSIGAINNSGQVLFGMGIYTIATQSNSSLPADSRGIQINDSGTVVGTNCAGSGRRAAVHSGGALTELVLIPGSVPGVDVTLGQGINATGQVIGFGGTANRTLFEGFVYSAGTMTAIPELPGSSPPKDRATDVYAIKDYGLVTGSAYTSHNTQQEEAYIYDSAHGTWIDIGPGSGSAINAKGEVTGSLNVGITYHTLSLPKRCAR